MYGHWIIEMAEMLATANARSIEEIKSFLSRQKAETHILADEAASRAYIRQVWAEAMTIYQSGNYSLVLPPELKEIARTAQREFMPEDSKAGLIQKFLDSYKGDYVCSLMLYQEALGNGLSEPKQQELREIGSIMNDSVTGWEKGAQHRFEIYGQQRSWRRVKAEAFPLIEEQLALPDGWA